MSRLEPVMLMAAIPLFLPKHASYGSQTMLELVPLIPTDCRICPCFRAPIVALSRMADVIWITSEDLPHTFYTTRGLATRQLLYQKVHRLSSATPSYHDLLLSNHHTDLPP